MAISKQDLLFSLGVEVDEAGIQESFAKVGKDIEAGWLGTIKKVLSEVSKGAGPGLAQTKAGLGTVTEGVKELTAPLLAKAGPVLEKIGSALSAVLGGISKQTAPALTTTEGWLNKVGSKVSSALGQFGKNVYGAGETVITSIKTGMDKVVAPVLGAIKPIYGQLEVALGPTVKAITKIGSGLKEVVGGLGKTVGGAMSSFWDQFNKSAAPKEDKEEDKEEGKKAAPKMTGLGSSSSSVFGGIMGIGGKDGMSGFAGAGGVKGLALGMVPMMLKGITSSFEAAGSAVAAPMKLVNSSLSVFGSALNNLQGSLGPIGMGLGLLTTGLQMVGDVIKAIPLAGSLLGPVLDAFTALPGILGNILTSLTQMSSLASPGLYKQWTMALEDVQAVIGRTFLPVLSLMTEAVRFFGDALATVLPSVDEMAYAMEPLTEAWNTLKSALKTFFTEHGPLLKTVFIAIFRGVANAVAFVVEKLKTFIDWLDTLADSLAPTFAGTAAPMASSQGAAARPASIQGLEEYQKSLQVSAFSQGAGATIPQKQLSVTQNIERMLDKLIQTVNSLWDTYAKPYWDKFVAWWDMVIDVWQKDIVPVLKGMWDVLKGITSILTGIGSVISAIFKGLAVAGEWIGDKFTKAFVGVFGEKAFTDIFASSKNEDWADKRNAEIQKQIKDGTFKPQSNLPPGFTYGRTPGAGGQMLPTINVTVPGRDPHNTGGAARP